MEVEVEVTYASVTVCACFHVRIRTRIRCVCVHMQDATSRASPSVCKVFKNPAPSVRYTAKSIYTHSALQNPPGRLQAVQL